MEKERKKINKGALSLFVFAGATIILWQLPGGNYILYPFTILGTWFHEMGHGLAAVFLGGNFHRLELYPNGSGLAVHSGGLFLGNIGSALVAAAGPLGPTIAGAVFIYASEKKKLTAFILFLLGLLLIASVILWIRPFFGFGSILILVFSILILFVSAKGSSSLKKMTLRFLGIQALVSLYLSVNYLFSSGAGVGGRGYHSDTMVIQNNLLLPYWFWGGAILLFSIFLIYKSIKYTYKKS